MIMTNIWTMIAAMFVAAALYDFIKMLWIYVLGEYNNRAKNKEPISYDDYETDYTQPVGFMTIEKDGYISKEHLFDVNFKHHINKDRSN